MVDTHVKITDQTISIHTFGKFYIKHGDEVISQSSNRSKRMWELFKYFLSHRGKVFFPEAILEKMWPDNNYSDPNLVMRALIFRLRQALNSKKEPASLAVNIVFSQGCYGWEDKTDYWLDADEFEKLVSEAEALLGQDQETAISLYRQAVALYNGEYLPELSYSEWLEPLRTYYHELYLSAVLKLLDLLKENRDYSGIIKVCEQANQVDYYEEKIHLKLMEALLADDQISRARAHYNEVTSAFYREMGIKPSEHMKNLYRLAGAEPGEFELDLHTIQEGLKGKEAVNGAYRCDPELFRYFYNLERLRTERSGQSILLGLFTVTTSDYSMPEKTILKEVIGNLEEVTVFSLRKGDVVTRWNEAQILIMLPGLNREQSDLVISRIEKKFYSSHSLNGLILHKKVESLLPTEEDAHFF